MKKNMTWKILVVLIVIAICLISFVGFYKKDRTQMINLLPDYQLAMDLSGQREVNLVVSKDTKEVIYDSEGNVSEEGKDDEGNLKEGYTKQDEKINPDENLTQENYRISKEMIEKRLKAMGAEEYQINQNLENGTITVRLPEDENTDTVISNLTYKGKFEIQDEDTKEVLMNNQDVKQAKAVYANTQTGTTVYLSIEFNKEGRKKLEEISKTYIETKDEEGKATTKNIGIYLDDEELLKTYFSEIIPTGILQLSVGNSTTSSETITSNLKEAAKIASLVTNNKMELQYELENNTYLSSIVGKEARTILLIAGVIIIVASLFYLCIQYKVNGILASVSYIGFLASLLLVLRYTNVPISLDGIVGIIVLLAVNYSFLLCVLKKMENNKKDRIIEIIKEASMHYAWVLLPLLILAVTFAFMKWIGIASMGMVMFWGIIILFLYHYFITKALLEK